MKMFIRRVLIVNWLMALLFAGGAWSADDAASLPEITDQPISHRVLDNGMEVLVSENHNAPVVALQIWVKAGSIYEERLLGAGVSHFIEHLAFKGPEGELKGRIAREVQSLGGEINAYTSRDQTVFLIKVPSRNWREALALLRSLVLEVDFQEEEVETEKEVILKEINMGRDEPDRRLHQLLWETAYRVHPYRFPVIGYRKLFREVSREQVLNYYRKWYVPNNMILVAAGDLPADAFFKEGGELFEPFPRQPYPVADIPPEPAQLGSREAEEVMDVAQARMALAFHIPSLHSPDLYPLDVLALLVGQGRSSTLYQKLREERGLVYSIGAYSYTPLYPGLFIIQARTDPEKVAEVGSAIQEILEGYGRDPVFAEDLAKARARVTSDYIHSLTTVEGRARELGSNQRVAGSPDFSRYYLEGIARVSAEDIQRVAVRYFKIENQTRAVIRPSTPVTVPTPPVVKTDNPIRKVVLENGLTVLIREDHSLPLVSVRMVFEGGVLAEKESDNGISQLVSRLLLKGTRERPALSIAREIEDYGGTISTYSARNSFGCSLEVLSDRIGPALEVLSDVVRNAAFPEEEIKKERLILLAAIRAESDDPRALAGRLLRKLLFGDHPYHFSVLGTEDSVRDLTREELDNFYRRYCCARNGVLAVFGDVTAEEMLPLIRGRFGDLPRGEKLKLKEALAVLPEGIREDILNKKEIRQAVVMQGFSGTDVYNPDRYALELLSSIFSGLSAPLFSKVRIEQGLAYYIGAYQLLGLSPGAFIFYAGTVPGSTEKIISAFREEIARVRGGKITPEELERNKNRLLGNFQFGLQTNGARAFQCAIDELYGLGYDAYRGYEETIRGLSVDDEARAAKKYFTPDNYALAVVEPEEGKVKK
ncbi:MAG: pitrilysin family protein [Candidatus Euphemobacter frigidus]|nr:pitrilysin family protein [Candidatus Euphemobacter frigidus]MDP8276116.1 pitrilysin family protein [Candidatus Euphemobacter frigidus]